jgi:hypothetical protein
MLSSTLPANQKRVKGPTLAAQGRQGGTETQSARAGLVSQRAETEKSASYILRLLWAIISHTDTGAGFDLQLFCCHCGSEPGSVDHGAHDCVTSPQVTRGHPASDSAGPDSAPVSPHGTGQPTSRSLRSGRPPRRSQNRPARRSRPTPDAPSGLAPMRPLLANVLLSRPVLAVVAEPPPPPCQCNSVHARQHLQMEDE